MINKYFKVLTAILFVGFLFFLFFIPLEMGDVWWHLKTGEWIIERGEVPHVDTFSDSKTPDNWILTQWAGSTT